MICPSVRGDNPRALATWLSPIQVGNFSVTIWANLVYVVYLSVDLARNEIFCATF